MNQGARTGFRGSRSRTLRVVVVTMGSSRSRYFEGALPLLRERGVEPTLVTLTSVGELHSALDRLGIPNYALGCERLSDHVGGSVRLARFLDKTGAGLVHAHEAIPAVVAAGAGASRRIPVVFHRHHDKSTGYQYVYSRLAGRLTRRTFAVSRSAACAARHEGVPDQKINLTPNGVSPLRPVQAGEVRALQDKLGIPPSASVILSMARFRPEKGLDVLIEAAFRVARSVPAIHLVLVGDGPSRSALETCARRCAALRTHFAGFQDDVAPWYALGDVVAIPSLREAFGLSAVEALAASRPLIASDVGGLPEVLENEVSGILVSPNEPDQLADGITRLLIHPAVAQRIAVNGYKRYRDMFTLERMVTGWLAAYSDVGDRGATELETEIPNR
jgi:glycosyltransferase involved in cell wall biosynthesis